MRRKLYSMQNSLLYTAQLWGSSGARSLSRETAVFSFLVRSIPAKHLPVSAQQGDTIFGGKGKPALRCKGDLAYMGGSLLLKNLGLVNGPFKEMFLYNCKSIPLKCFPHACSTMHSVTSHFTRLSDSWWTFTTMRRKYCIQKGEISEYRITPVCDYS